MEAREASLAELYGTGRGGGGGGLISLISTKGRRVLTELILYCLKLTAYF